MYQHSVDKSSLSKELHGCVELTVASVGVDVKTASLSLLQYLPGLGKQKASLILEARGKLEGIEDLKKIKGIGPKLFNQIGGFLFLSDGKKLVDRIPHILPDHIPLLEKLQKKYGETLTQFQWNSYTFFKLHSLFPKSQLE